MFLPWSVQQLCWQFEVVITVREDRRNSCMEFTMRTRDGKHEATRRVDVAEMLAARDLRPLAEAMFYKLIEEINGMRMKPVVGFDPDAAARWADGAYCCVRCRIVPLAGVDCCAFARRGA